MVVTFVNRLLGITRGGGENFDLNMARALGKLGCDPGFVVGRRLGKLDEPLREFPTTYVATPYLRGLMYRWEPGRKLTRILGGLAALADRSMFETAALRKLGRQGLAKPDVFQICGLPKLAAKLEARLGRPSVVRWPGPPGPKLAQWRFTFAASIANGSAFENARQFDPETQEIQVGVDTQMFSPGSGLGKR